MSEVLVLGATGAIGREIVAELVARGHGVVGVARDARRLQSLKDHVRAPERLTLLARPIASESDGTLLTRALRALPRPVTAVVTALRGQRESARLLDHSAAQLERTLHADVVTQFIAAKHLLPLLAEARPDGGRYLLLSGPMGNCAWSGYGHVSVAAAALRMLTDVLREEAKELPVAVQQLQIGTPVRCEANEDRACADWVGADEVARRVADLIEQRGDLTPIVEFGAYGTGRRVTPVQSRSFP